MNLVSNPVGAMSTMGQRIRNARRSAGLSQASLAKRSAVTASAVAQWEHPFGTHPALNRLPLIANATGVSVEWLVSGTALKTNRSLECIVAEPPAIVFDVYAETMEEETLLKNFRLMPPKTRALLSGLAYEFAASRRRLKR